MKPRLIDLWNGNRFAVVLLSALPLAYPLAWGKMFLGQVPFFGEVPLINLPVIALLAGAVIFWQADSLRMIWRNSFAGKIILSVAAAGIAVIVVQQIRYGFSLHQLLTGLFYFAMPIAGMQLGRRMLRLLPGWLMVLFLAAAAVTVREMVTGQFAVGVVGNWNWNWTLLTATAPAVAMLLPVRWRLTGAGVMVAAVLLLPYWLAAGYTSRGTLLACCGSLVVLAVASVLHNHPNGRRVAYWVLPLLVVVAMVAVCVILNAETVRSRTDSASRIRLWQGSLALARDNTLTGVEPGRFEGEIGFYLPPEYYDTRYAADRHPHPHNEWLYYWGGFGVTGLIWAILTAVLGFHALMLRKRRDQSMLLAGWVWLMLLIHGQVDVLLSHPLTGGLFLLLTGLLLAQCIGGTRGPMSHRRGGGLRLAPVILLVMAAGLASLNLVSGWYLRQGKLALLAGNTDRAHSNLLRANSWNSTPESAYVTGTVELFDRKDPTAALGWFRLISAEHNLPSYSHSQGRIARALAAAGRLEESLEYFEQEQQLFPRSAVNLYFRIMVERRLGMAEAADKHQQLWESLLQQKEVAPQEFIHLILDQTLDDSPVERELFLRNLRHDPL